MLKSVSFLLAFIALLHHVDGKCFSQIKEDVVFLLDCSGSVNKKTDWPKMIDFVADAVVNAVPADARIGVATFATSSKIEVNFDDPANVDRQTLSNHITTKNIKYTSGGTYPRTGIENIINNVFDAFPSTNAKKIVLMTDGKPSSLDYTCDIQQTLQQRGIRVIIIGIGKWNAGSVISCLVQNAGDITQITNFNDFKLLQGALEESICANDFDLRVSEIQPFKQSNAKGDFSDNYIEFYNAGQKADVLDLEFDGTQVGAQKIPGLFEGKIDQSIEVVQGGVLLVSTANKAPSTCKAPQCVFYSWPAQSSAHKVNPIGFPVSPQNIWTTTVKYDNVAVNSITWDASWPDIISHYSYELKNENLLTRDSASWRQTCDIWDGASTLPPGAGKLPNAACQNDCNEAKCAQGKDPKPTNFCDLNNRQKPCQCSDKYYYDSSTCTKLPEISQCTAVLQPSDGCKSDKWQLTYKNSKLRSGVLSKLIISTAANVTIETSLGQHNHSVTYLPPDTQGGITAQTGIITTSLKNYVNCELYSKQLKGKTQRADTPCVDTPELQVKLSDEVDCRLITSSPTPSPTYEPTKAMDPITSCQVFRNGDKRTGTIRWTFNSNYVYPDDRVTIAGFDIEIETKTSKGGNSQEIQSVFVNYGKDTVDVTGLDTLGGKEKHLTVEIKVLGERDDGVSFYSAPVSCSKHQIDPVDAPDACSVSIRPKLSGADIDIDLPSNPSYANVNYLATVTELVNGQSYKNDFPVKEISKNGLKMTGELTNWKSFSNQSPDSVALKAVFTNLTIAKAESNTTICEIKTPKPTKAPTPSPITFPNGVLDPNSCTAEILFNTGVPPFGPMAKITWTVPQFNPPITQVSYNFKNFAASKWTDFPPSATTHTIKWEAYDIIGGKFRILPNLQIRSAVQDTNKATGASKTVYSPGTVVCKTITPRPTSMPTMTPTLHPSTFAPSSSPTPAPTFSAPVVSFEQGEWQAQESEYAEYSIWLNIFPFPLHTIDVAYEITKVDENGNALPGPVQDFTDENGVPRSSVGVVTVGYQAPQECTYCRPDLKAKNMCCPENHDCVKNGEVDLCVRNANYRARLYLGMIPKDGQPGTENFKISLMPSKKWMFRRVNGTAVDYQNYYSNDTAQYIVGSINAVANYKVFDADYPPVASKEYCEFAPDSDVCNVQAEKKTPWYYYLIIVALAICLLCACYQVRVQYILKEEEKYQKEVNEKDLKDKIRDEETGGGLGLNEQINPLAAGNQQTRVGHSVGQEFGDASGFGVDDDDGDLVAEFGRKDFGPGKFHTRL